MTEQDITKLFPTHKKSSWAGSFDRNKIYEIRLQNAP